MAAITCQPVSVDSSQGYQRTFPNGVIVRNMNAKDGEFAGKLLVQGFQSKFEHAVGRNNLEKAAQATAEFQRHFVEAFQRTFIAEFDGRPAGLMELRFHGDRDDGDSNAFFQMLGCWATCRLLCMFHIADEKSIPIGSCYLDHIAVDEGFRGKGIGKVLMDVADEEALKRNCKIIYLWVAHDNRARHLYERQGYTVVREEGGCITKCGTGINKFLKMDKRLAL